MSFVSRLFVFLFLILFASCNGGNKNLEEKAILGYLANCVGGSLATCSHNCQNLWGSTVTPDNVVQLNTCIGNCNTYCSIDNLLFQLSQAK
ncbi:hypothetical protein CH373_10010 [Leptospira perolatii]|uniref:Cys-rich protein n=2 Tax=Leptospira perolatii TaxID=2023191 RepID=A0A2M9ZMP2_9LEPT|nr:hypothetical protein CH360_07755 [Leptospira perolatii]PJZ73297.1 hypothetical protein CH373_10010 [Leptospira perolatii]